MEKTIGERIAGLRKQKHLTQIQLAEKLHISDKAVSKWESNKSDPSLEMLIALSDYFKCTIDYLVKGETLVVGNGTEAKFFNTRAIFVNTLDLIKPKLDVDGYLELFNLRPLKVFEGCLYLMPSQRRVDVSKLTPALDLFIEGVASVCNEIKDVKVFRDDLLMDSLRLILKLENASISQLQRSFGIGFPRACKLIDEIEEHGFISSPNKDKVREVYITPEMFKGIFGIDA